MIIQFATNSYTSNSLPLSAQRCVNAYAEREPPPPGGAKSPIAVFGAPGLTAFAICGTGPVRGMHVMGGLLYVVSGQTLYSVSSTGVVTTLGGAVTGNGVVSMADNGTQLCIVNGTNGYIYSVSLGFVVISDPNFHAANVVTFFDNVFVFNWAGTNKFFISNTLDGLNYNGLAFGSAEVTSANLFSVVNQQETLLLFSGDHTETWYDAGAVNMPFLRVDGATIERGCAAALTTVKEDNSVFFLGNDLIFYRLNITQPVRVSTHAIEDAWQSYSTVSDAFAFSYTFEGHKFVVITFPTANKTWVYDISTGLWHERESLDMNNRTYGRWRGNCYAQCYNHGLVGDQFSGAIGYLDRVNFTEFGNTMREVLVSPPLSNERKRTFVSLFELDVETGVGLPTGQGSDPQIMLDWSRDGGRTFVGLSLWDTMGKIGQYLTRVRWLRLGQSRQWYFRVTITDPVRRTIIAASGDVSSGM